MTEVRGTSVCVLMVGTSVGTLQITYNSSKGALNGEIWTTVEIAFVGQVAD